MLQQSLWPVTNGTPAIVNVASVPQRSVFRYPGGKTWFVPHARRWLMHLPRRPRVLLEPFAGGGIIGLTAAFENLADQVMFAELDDGVAAVWQTLLSDDAPALAERIEGFNLTADSIEVSLAEPASTVVTLAFQTILRNRVNRGGILAAGAGRIKHGENGRGLVSRWYPQTLAARIRAIYAIRHRLTFVPGDGLMLMKEYADEPDAVVFVDPPYTAGGKRAGQRLYTHHEVNHDGLFALATQFSGDVLLTYDNNPAVIALAQQHGLSWRALAMKSTHHAQMTECVIARDLAWF